MKISSIKSHLRPYNMVAKRKTTINHAFASAIAPNDDYDERRVFEAMQSLGMHTEDLKCVYCKNAAETWDHIVGTVQGGVFSGFGHVLGNLVPCCKQCNSRKGNKLFEDFVRDDVGLSGARAIELIDRIRAHQLRCGCPGVSYDDIRRACPHEVRRLEEIKEQIIELMTEADRLAETVKSQYLH